MQDGVHSMTPEQQGAIHLYCERVAESLNDRDIDLQAVLTAKPIPVSCTKENIKENVLKPIMKALFPEKKSTMDLGNSQVNEVYEHINRS